MALVRGLHEVVQLTQEVHEQNGFVVEVLQPMHLLLVEVLHLVGCDDVVVVEVYHLEPVLKRAHRRLVLLAQHEPHEIFIIHLILHVALEPPRNLLEYSIYGLPREGVPLIPRKVLLVDEEVVVGVELPEAAVEHVEVLVGKILTNHIDVALVADLDEGLHQVRLLKISPSYLPVVVRVESEEYSHHHRVSVPVLELGGRLQELQAGVGLEQVLEQGLEVIRHNYRSILILSEEEEHAALWRLSIVVLLEKIDEGLLGHVLRLLVDLLLLLDGVEQHPLEYLRYFANVYAQPLEVSQCHLLLLLALELLLYALFGLQPLLLGEGLALGVEELWDLGADCILVLQLLLPDLLLELHVLATFGLLVGCVLGTLAGLANYTFWDFLSYALRLDLAGGRLLRHQVKFLVWLFAGLTGLTLGGLESLGVGAAGATVY